METWILVGILLFLIFLIYWSHCDCRRGFRVGGITDPLPGQCTMKNQGGVVINGTLLEGKVCFKASPEISAQGDWETHQRWWATEYCCDKNKCLNGDIEAKTGTYVCNDPLSKRAELSKPEDICMDKNDLTECCKKCRNLDDETACICPKGESYNCSEKRCVPNCICPNGEPATGDECGNQYGVKKCKSCFDGYSKLSDGTCAVQCGFDNQYGTCAGVKNRGSWENDTPHREGDNCCPCGNTYKCCGHECGRGKTGCHGDTQHNDICKPSKII